MLIHKIFQPIAQLCSDSTKGSTFCCIQRLLMMSLHVYVTLLNKKYSLVCLVRKNRKLVGVILDQKHSVADVIQTTLFLNFQCTGLTALSNFLVSCQIKIYRSRAVKSRTQLFEASLLHRKISLCTVTFGEKVLTFARSRGS